MRLIDADALKEDIMQSCLFAKEWDYALVEQAIDAQFTIDAVPVVRCKDCKYWQQATPNSGNCCMGFAPTAYADDFCSFGERSEE